MTTAAERKTFNEGTFRDANEKLGRGAREILGGDDGSPVPFLCECPRRECIEVVLLTLSEYEAVRDHPRRGLAAVGHEDESIERVVERNERFLVTEKFGEAGRIHEENDPRREDARTRRIGENEALYRQINERLEEVNESFGKLSGVFAVMCECGDRECAEQLEVPREAYEKARANAAAFILKPGHEIERVEHVVERRDAYVIVQKDPGPARRVAEETDNRGT